MDSNPYALITKGDKAPKKEISHMIHKKSHNGKHLVTHVHHHPEHHRDELHAFNTMDELHDHMQQHETGADGAAPMTAAPSPMPAPAPEAGAPAAGM